MANEYFKRFCASISDSEQCQTWADETERGDRTQESLYELLLREYGEEAVAQAHINAMKETETNTATEQQPKAEQTQTGRGEVPIAQQRHITPTTTITQPETKEPERKQTTTQEQGPQAEEIIMQKVQELQKKKEKEQKREATQRRTAENEQRTEKGVSVPKPQPPPQKEGNMPAAPSNLEDICRVCVTPPTMAILEVLKLWYTGDDVKFIEEIVDKVGDESILLEEALAQVFIKDKSSLDGIERTLQDFNEVLAEALRIAASRSPELKAYFDRERAELEGEEAESQSGRRETEEGS